MTVHTATFKGARRQTFRRQKTDDSCSRAGDAVRLMCPCQLRQHAPRKLNHLDSRDTLHAEESHGTM